MVRTELFTVAPAARAFGFGRGDRIGAEVELMPMLRDASAAARALPLDPPRDGGPSIRALLDEMVRGGGWVDDTQAESPSLVGPGGGRITLEPAGQVEYSSPVFAGARDVVDDLERAVESVAAAASRLGLVLFARGYNTAVDEDQLRLIVAKPRYLAMDRHFAGIGPFGRRMMRSTCALQINLDFGAGDIASERWRLANMLAPSLNAVFANAPHREGGRRFRSYRSEIWRRADPCRTGRLFDRPDLDPVADYLRFALDATVMMVRDGDGERPVEGEMTFARWLGGDTRYGFPTMDDWRIHLTTLFPDVRAKGWMEFRSIDMLPREWWGVPIAILSTLIYNADVRREALIRLEARQRRSSGDGEHDGCWLSDYTTGAEVFALALPAIADAGLAERARRYFDTFIARGITPADVPGADDLDADAVPVLAVGNETTR